MSADRGATWSTIRVGTTRRRSIPGVSGVAAVVASGSAVAVAWVKDGDGTVRFRRSTDGGATWSHARTLGTGSTQQSQLGLAFRGGRIAATWVAAGAVRVRIRGISGWETVRTIEAPAMPHAYTEVLDVDVDLHGTSAIGVAFSACWVDCEGSGAADVLWAESADHGATWTPAGVVLEGGENPIGEGPVLVVRADVLWAPDGTRYLAATEILDYLDSTVPFRIGVGS